MVMFSQAHGGSDGASVRGRAAAVHAALDAIPSALTVLDADLRLVHANTAAFAMFAGAPADRSGERYQPSVGRSLAGVLAGAVCASRSRNALEVASTSEVGIGGAVFRVVIRPVVEDDGALSGAVVEWEDISEERALDACIASALTADTEAGHPVNGSGLATALRRTFSALTRGRRSAPSRRDWAITGFAPSTRLSPG